MADQQYKQTDSSVINTHLVLPSHTNALNSIFGGVIMSWIDISAAIAAQRHCRGAVVTASIDALDFIAPVYVGWVVNLKSQVNFVARTSMEVGVRVDAENPRTGEVFHTASAYLTFVSINEEGKPQKVPGLWVEGEKNRQRQAAAQVRRDYRLKEKKEKYKL